MVGELQVLSTSMQRETLPQQLQRHHDTLGMPTRTTFAERRRPHRLSRLRLLPEGKVERGALLLVHFDPRPGAERVERLLCEKAVAVDSGDLEVDAVRSLIGDAASDELGDHLDHLLDVVGGVRHDRRPGNPEGIHGLPPLLLVLDRHLVRAPMLEIREVDDLVVDIGHVRDVTYLDAGRFEITPQDVVGQGGTPVPDVGRSVHRRAAHVQPDLPLVETAERRLGSGRRVVEP
jgi:hypothetical protein